MRRGGGKQVRSRCEHVLEDFLALLRSLGFRVDEVSATCDGACAFMALHAKHLFAHLARSTCPCIHRACMPPSQPVVPGM